MTETERDRQTEGDRERVRQRQRDRDRQRQTETERETEREIYSSMGGSVGYSSNESSGAEFHWFISFSFVGVIVCSQE